MNAPLPASHPQSQDSRHSGSFLQQLHRAQSELDLAIMVMEAATQAQAPMPDKSSYATARWKLSLASRHRRSLIGRICQRLTPLVSPDDAATLKGLHQRDMEMLHNSAAHVGRWTLEAIEHDWDGYRQASRKIRLSMSARIDEEKHLLYPILQIYPRIG